MKRITAILISLLLIISVFAACGANNDNGEKKLDPEATLSLWTDEADSKEALVEYINEVTDESDDDFIPVENRIAVFDLDGTLFCETDPTYFD